MPNNFWTELRSVLKDLPTGIIAEDRVSQVVVHLLGRVWDELRGGSDTK
jgi:hypothetical protein